MQIERLAEAFDGFDDRHHSVTISDARRPDLPLVYANVGFTAFSGYSRDEALGRNCRFLQKNRTNQPGLERIRTAIKAREGCLVDLINCRRDGSPLYNRLSLHPVFDPVGEFVFYIGLQSNLGPLIRVQGRIAEHFRAKGLAIPDLLTD